MSLIPPVMMHRRSDESAGLIIKPVTKAVSREFATMLTGAFGLVAALAWSDAVKGAFESLGKFNQWRVVGPFAFAAVVTLITLMVSSSLSKYTKDNCTRLCTA